MPKYASLRRRHSASHPKTSSPAGARENRSTAPSPVRVVLQREERVGIHIEGAKRTPKAAEAEAKELPVLESSPPPPPPPPPPPLESPRRPIQRVVYREIATNTELDLDQELQQRDAKLKAMETALMEREQAILAREAALKTDESQTEQRLHELQEELAIARRQAQDTDAKLKQTQHLLDEKAAAQIDAERNFQAVQQRLQNETETLQQHVERLQRQLDAQEASARQQLQSRDATQSELQQTIERLQSERQRDALAIREAEQRTQQQLREEHERRCRELDDAARTRQRDLESRVELLTRQLSDAASTVRDSESRYQTLDQQLRELHTRHEQLRLESLQRDEELYRSRKALQAKQSEVDDVKALLVKSAERQDRLQQQQQQWYDKQLQASVLSLELEFRRERELATRTLQAAQRKYQTALQQTARFKSAYEASLQRETQLKEETARLRAAMADDQRKLLQQDEAVRAGFALRLQRLDDEKQALRDELVLAQDKLTAIPALQRELEAAATAAEKTEELLKQRDDALAVASQRERDLQAALKVKDVMLDDQLRQLEELRHAQRELERDAGEWQAQVDDLEAALDDHIQRLSEAEDQRNELQRELDLARERVIELKGERALVEQQIERKDTALALIEGEMERLREALSNQEALLERRLQKRLERLHEATAREQLASEDERATTGRGV
ncbi:hypothetical protein PINS_up023990 [Pythium insidiosum]|nr:hypothetical protein PINS_up023990 [Pythium insidiosum]